MQMPAAFAYAMGHEKHDWRYLSEVEPGIDNRRMTFPRGKGLCGSSSINAMCFTRGHPPILTAGPAMAYPTGLTPTACRISKEWRPGAVGPMRIGAGTGRYGLPHRCSAVRFVMCSWKACGQAGYPPTSDSNGVFQDGFGVSDQTIHEGRRMSTARAYLAPVRGRANLTVRTGCEINRLLFEGSRTTGVEYVRFEQLHTAGASTEVVVCAGAINSPKLLMLSGIGDETALSKHGVEVVRHLPAVGQHMQDHLDIYIQQLASKPVTTTPALKLHRKALIGLRWLLTRRGAAATNHFEALSYIRTDASLPQPNLMSWFCSLDRECRRQPDRARARLHADGDAAAAPEPRRGDAFVKRPARPAKNCQSLFRGARRSGGASRGGKTRS